MTAETLEQLLVAVLAGGRPGPRDLRDALSSYLAVCAGIPVAAASLRVRGHFVGLKSSWDQPTTADLATVRARLDAERTARPELARARALLDELGLQVVVRERLRAMSRPKGRRFFVVEGGCEQSPPRGRLALVAAGDPSPPAGGKTVG